MEQLEHQNAQHREKNEELHKEMIQHAGEISVLHNKNEELVTEWKVANMMAHDFADQVRVLQDRCMAPGGGPPS